MIYFERNKRIYLDRQAGSTLKALAETHGISPERVRQIVNKFARLLRHRVIKL